MRLDELSDALHQQADTVQDGSAADRLNSVRGRVRAARRRRTAAVSAAAVAAVAAVGVAVMPGVVDRDPGPADAPSVLAGHDVPQTLEANGFTYEYAEGVAGEPGENPLELSVDIAEEPRLVSFASSESGSTLLAESGEYGEMGGPSGDFSTHLLLVPGVSHDTVTLRQLEGLGDGTLALAVYDLAEDPPPGVTDGRSTFRDEVAGWTLVDGVIGEPGQTEVTLDVVLPEGRLGWDILCQSDPSSRVRHSVEGIEGWAGTRCEQAVPGAPVVGAQHRDPWAAGADPAPRGRPVETRIWLQPWEAAGGEKPVAEDPEAVIGLAVYVADSSPVSVMGEQLDPAYEAYGHEWQVSAVEPVEGRDGRFTAALPASPEARTVKLVVTTDPDLLTSVSAEVDGRSDGDASFQTFDTLLILGPYVVLPGEEREVVVEYFGTVPAEAEVAMVTGVLAD